MVVVLALKLDSLHILNRCFFRAVSRLRFFVKRYTPSYVVGSRVVLAYLVSRVDHLAKTSALLDSFLDDPQPSLHSRKTRQRWAFFALQFW